MKISEVVSILFVFCICPVAHGISTYCQAHLAPVGKNISLPQLPGDFTAHIEMNFGEINKTTNIVEYFDNLGNRAALKITSAAGGSQPSEVQLIFDYSNDQLLHISDDGSCQVSELMSSYESDLFGYKFVDGNVNILTSNDALKFGRAYGENYLGKDTVRGITVNHWQTCMYWARMNANMTVDYYFSDPDNWTPSSFLDSVPVRADVNGEIVNPDGSVQEFRHVYDYFNFIPEVSDELFETPPGVICRGRKNTRMIPKFPLQFHYRTEIVYPSDGYMTNNDVWYDHTNKLIRTDFRPLTPTPPLYSMNPLNQIDDFDTGLRYIKDNILGNCSIYQLQNTTFGAYENQTLFQRNGSYSIQLKDPLQLFYLNDNFTYVGERNCRGMICDAFSALVNNFVVDGNTATINVTVEILFLSGDMTSYPNTGDKISSVVPVSMTITSTQSDVPFYQIINVMDFDPESVSRDVFDVSSCYSEISKLHISIRFPGIFSQDTADTFKSKARSLMAELGQIREQRIQDLSLDYDIGDIFLSATLLDRSPAIAEFSYVHGKGSERQDDKVIANIKQPAQCADACVDETKFTCNSFDFCIGDSAGTCRLSKHHSGDGTTVNPNAQCRHFSRTVNGPRVPEKTVLQVYSLLRIAIYNQNFYFQLQQSDQQVIKYEGIDTSINFGMIAPMSMPRLPSQFYYTQEIVIPSLAQAYDSKVWYDSAYKLVRYDFKDSIATPPFYSTNPMTIIHDFNTGVAYTMDKYYENCTVNAIKAGTFDAQVDASELKIGAYVVQMKNPFSLLQAANNFRFVGQKTIRGMLCNGFESLVSNFTMPGLQGVNTGLLRYFFLEKGWIQVGENTGDLTYLVPVRLEITVLQHGFFLAYNFFDFEERHPDLSIFDIKQCFPEEEKHHFQIQFPGQFHPYLDIYQKIFVAKAQYAMAKATSASVIRFQDTAIDYDDSNVYITSTLMGRTPFLAGFTKLPGKMMPHRSDGIVNGIKTATDCADLCLSISSFQCNSFDFCPSKNYCFLDKSHLQDGAVASNVSICDHYSRTVNASVNPSPALLTVYLNLKNTVYRDQLAISIPISDSKVKIYQADEIRDDIIRPPSNQQPGRLLRGYTKYSSRVLVGNNDKKISGVAVDDCAASCYMEELFDCESFEYCYNNGQCVLSRIHPEENTANTTTSSSCDLYSRSYINRYTELPGKTFATQATLQTLTTQTANLCAQKCTLNPHCKSFDYCDNIKSCRLMQNHTLDVPNAVFTASPVCNHYSRQYRDDFQRIASKTIKIGASLEFKDVSVDQCAKLCIEEESLQCATFTYCGNGTICSLRAVAVRPAVQTGGVLYSGVCDLYSRRFIPSHGPPPSGTSIPTGSSPQVQYKTNKGALAGTAIAMLLVGIILGAAAIYCFRKYQNKGGDDMHMQFVKSDSESS